MANKVKVPGGAFSAGDGLTVDPITRTVSAGGIAVSTLQGNIGYFLTSWITK